MCFSIQKLRQLSVGKSFQCLGVLGLKNKQMMEGWMDGGTEGRREGWRDRGMDEWMMIGWIDGRKDGGMEGRREGGIHG
jgi:hypothetical protein